MRRAPLPLCTALVLWAIPCSAQVTTAPYLTSKAQELLGFEDIDFDTGWVPAGSPIQVRFYAHAGNTVTVTMDGEGLYDWTQEAISFEGHPDGGSFDIDIGVQIEAQVRFDIANITWTGDLIDPFAYGVFDTAFFDPYLLEGNPDRPAVIDFEIPREQLASLDLGINIGGASGSLVVDLGGLAHGELEGSSITAWSATQTSHYTQVLDEGAWGELPPDLAWTDFDTLAQLRARVSAGLTVILYPAVVVHVLGNDYTLVEFEIPIEIPPVEDEWSFDPVPLLFEAPTEPTPGDDDDSSGGQIVHGGADDGDAEYASVGGCGCDTATATGFMGLTLLPAALLLRRRRD